MRGASDVEVWFAQRVVGDGLCGVVYHPISPKIVMNSEVSSAPKETESRLRACVAERIDKGTSV